MVKSMFSKHGAFALTPEWKGGKKERREGGRKVEGRQEGKKEGGGRASSKYPLPQTKEPTKPPWLCDKPTNYPPWLRDILGVTNRSPRAGMDMAVSAQHKATPDLEPRLSFIQRLWRSGGKHTRKLPCCPISDMR